MRYLYRCPRKWCGEETTVSHGVNERPNWHDIACFNCRAERGPSRLPDGHWLMRRVITGGTGFFTRSGGGERSSKAQGRFS